MGKVAARSVCSKHLSDEGSHAASTLTEPLMSSSLIPSINVHVFVIYDKYFMDLKFFTLKTICELFWSS